MDTEAQKHNRSAGLADESVSIPTASLAAKNSPKQMPKIPDRAGGIQFTPPRLRR